MKDKEKQIEEILTDIRKFIGYDTPYTEKKALADYLFEHYQPKLSEDSVVLSREEWKTVNKFANELEVEKEENEKRHQSEIQRLWGLITELKYKLQKERKESIEKFVKDLLAVWDDLEKWSKKYYEPHSGITPAHIKELAKQLGVEIKE